MLCAKCGKETDASGRFCQWCGADLAHQQKAARSETQDEAEEFAELAGLGRRFVAFLIDVIFIVIIDVFAMGILGFTDSVIGLTKLARGTPMTEVFGAGSLSQVLAPVFTAVAVLFVVVPWLYFAGLECSRNQATLGKMALQVVVTDMHGRRISFARATLRYFAKFLSALIIFVGFIMIALTRRKQGLHDRIAGTLAFVQR